MKKINIILTAVLFLTTPLINFNHELKASTLDLNLKKNSPELPSNERTVQSGKIMIDLDGVFNYLQMYGLISDTGGFIVGMNSNPSLGFHYFLFDSLSLGTRISYQIYKSKIDGYVQLSHSWGFEPRVTYFFNFFENLHLFSGTGFTYTSTVEDLSEEKSKSNSSIGLDLFFGVNYMFVEQVGLFSEFSYVYRKLEEEDADGLLLAEIKQHSTLVSVGFKIFI